MVVSAGFVETQRLLGTRLQPDYGDRLCLDDEDLQTAAHVYGQWLAAADERIQRVLGQAPDPLQYCLICHDTLRTQLNDGEWAAGLAFGPRPVQFGWLFVWSTHC